VNLLQLPDGDVGVNLRRLQRRVAQHRLDMSRRSTRRRPPQGAHLAQLRQAAGLTQAELAAALGETQQNVAFWEFASKPPRSDVLPQLAKALGVTVEAILSPGAAHIAQRRGPKGKLLEAFEAASSLPKGQQEKLREVIDAMVQGFRRKAG
jgi:transcriptional regulator with XRE-family HTH domain